MHNPIFSFPGKVSRGLRFLRPLIVVILLGIAGKGSAQKKPATPMPDVNRLMAMSPAERERYADSLKKAFAKYATNTADEAGIAIDQTIMPGANIQPPPKDLKRLAMIPSLPPTRAELVQQVQKSRDQLQTVIPKPEMQEIRKFEQSNNAAVVHDAAIATFYNNEPAKALYLMMSTALRQPDSILVLNNLGALYNLAGLQHRAVSVLMHCLQREKESSMILNNLGQSYFGLGDLTKARHYLNKCLEIDSLNPDANRSMGMIHVIQKEPDAAKRCFERELSVCVRTSTLVYLERLGKNTNLRSIIARKNAYNGRTPKNHVADIQLVKFKIPSFPTSVEQAYEQVPEFELFAQSLQAEASYWRQRAMPSQAAMQAEGEKYFGPYHELANALLKELHTEFTPEYLTNISEKDVATGMEIMSLYQRELAKVKCPSAPPGSSLAVQEAYDIKCCIELKQPLVNQRITEYGGFFEARVKVGQRRWNDYLNELIEIVQIDPTLANQMMVYQAVSQYLNYLATGCLYSGTAEATNNALPRCKPGYELDKADSLIQADRNWQLQCPSFLNIEVDVEVAKIKADCTKYSLEVGNSIVGQYEYDFKTGSSTFLAGVGVKAKFLAGTGKASIKAMGYITFDNNNSFADMGTRLKVEAGIGDTPFKAGPVKFGGTLAGTEGTIQNGINSGLTSNVKGKGALADFVKIDQAL